MAFYDRLNAVVDYLESHLDSEVDYRELARRAGTNLNTLQRIFPLLANITITDYLRQRRLTLAGRDLAQTDLRIIDLAMKYGYTSTAAFSRAFTRFHGIKPSEVKRQASKLRYYPRLVFRRQAIDPGLEYEIIELDRLQLYGLSIQTDLAHIRHDAPTLHIVAEREHPALGHADYGMISYHETRDSEDGYEYWVLWQKPAPGLTPYTVSAQRWLKFRIPSQEASAIQAASDLFYEKFLPTCEYELTPEPELEHYHDGITDFLIPIR